MSKSHNFRLTNHLLKKGVSRTTASQGEPGSIAARFSWLAATPDIRPTTADSWDGSDEMYTVTAPSSDRIEDMQKEKSPCDFN